MFGCLMRYIFYSVILFILFSASTFAQVSGYGSVTYGYHSNPLYNYMNLGDQLRQSYVQFDYSSSSKDYGIKTGYVGGLMLFNRFSDRNYYEHYITTVYRKVYKKKIKPADSSALSLNNIQSPSATEEDETKPLSKIEEPSDDSVSERDTTGIQDSSDVNSEENEISDTTEQDTPEVEEEEDDVFTKEPLTYLDIAVKFGARHDKPEFKEFNSIGAELSALYKTEISQSVNLSISNRLGLRNYLNVNPLSNITDILDFNLTLNSDKQFQYGLSLSAGVKYYTSNAIDTSYLTGVEYLIQVDTIKSGKIIRIVQDTISVDTVEVPSPYSMPAGSMQYSAGTFIKYLWSSGNIQAQALYRYNPKTTTRFLSSYINSSRLNEDIYHESFSYRGFNLKFSFAQKLFYNINLAVEGELLEKNFEIKAFGLDGYAKSKKRSDFAYVFDINISRNFNISEYFSIDATISGQVFNNNSNDNYNKYKGYSIAASVGIGF